MSGFIYIMTNGYILWGLLSANDILSTNNSLLDTAIYWKYRHVDYSHIEFFSNINIIFKKEIHLYGSLSAIKQMLGFIVIKYFLSDFYDENAQIEFSVSLKDIWKRKVV